MLKAIGVSAVALGTLAWVALAREPVTEPVVDGPSQPDPYHPAEGAGSMFGSPGPWNAELVFELGSLDGPDAIGQIMDVAVSADSLIAVVDRFGCAVRVFHFPSGELVSDLGGCGDGPGEFRQVSSVAFKADTLLVSDFGRARIVRMDPRTGVELTGSPPPLSRMEAPLIVFHALPDRILYAPGWWQTNRRELLVAQMDDGREWVGLTDATISLENRDESLMRRGEVCLFGGDGRVLAANIWALQAVVLDADLEPLFDHRDELPWFEPREEGGRGRWMPGALGPRVACAENFGVVRYRTNETMESGRLRVGRGMLLVVSSRGEILQREVVADTAWPHAAALTPIAGLGDVIFLYQNGFGPHPSIHGYRIVLEGGSG